MGKAGQQKRADHPPAEQPTTPASAFVGVPGLGTFSLTASSFTPIKPLLFHLSEVTVPHGVLIAVGTGDGFRRA